LLDKFVIQYPGNMGYVHDVETIIAAAAQLRDLSDVHILFIGSGAKQEWLEQEIERHGLENVTRIGQQPCSEQNIFLNACDVAIMALSRLKNSKLIPAKAPARIKYRVGRL
jgi:glycosyltransferase involved in cell wall biosynthesis